MKKILWITFPMPSPLLTGDALYSTGILTALASTGEVAITVIGTRRDERPVDARLLNLPGIDFIDIPPQKRLGLLSLLTSLPRDAYGDASSEVRQALAPLLERDWDWIVFDHGRSSAFLPMVLQHRKQASICYLAHNAEGKIRPEIAGSVKDPLRRTIMHLDARKYCRLEARLVEAADTIISITDADAAYFAQFGKSTFVVPPVYLGKPSTEMIDQNRPRSILLLGSFEWVAKQRNLQQIVETVVPALKDRGITLDVVGIVPDEVRNRYAELQPHVAFHGPIADLSQALGKSRGGLVAEVLGGGFKLKLLDYAFARLPVFGLKMSMNGSSAEEQSAMFLGETMEDVAAQIVNNIDDIDALNGSQARLLDLMSSRFGLEQGIQRLRGIFIGN